MENFKTRSIKRVLFDPEAFPTNTGRKTNSQLVYSGSFDAEVVSSQARPSISAPDSQGNQRQLFSARHTLDLAIRDRYRAGLGGTPGYDFPFNLSAFAIVTEKNDDGTPKSWQFYKLISLEELDDNQLLITLESDTEEFSRYATGANAIPDLITHVDELTFFLGSAPSLSISGHDPGGLTQSDFEKTFFEFTHTSSSPSTYRRTAESLFLGRDDVLFIGFTQNDLGIIDLPERLTITSDDGTILMTQENYAARALSKRFSSNKFMYKGVVAFYDVNPFYTFLRGDGVVVSF